MTANRSKRSPRAGKIRPHAKHAGSLPKQPVLAATVRDPSILVRRPKAAYAPTQLVFSSVRRLTKTLGELTAHINMMELAMRDMYARAAEHDSGPRGYISILKKRHRGIDAEFSPAEAVHNNAARWSIVQLTVVARAFFKSFAAEYIELKKHPDWEYHWGKDTPDPFQVLLHNLPESISDALGISLNVKIVNYYRAVRNGTIHGSWTTAQTMWAQLQEDATDFAISYRGFPPISSPDQIKHHDFRIYQRAIVRMATEINDLCKLTPQDIFSKWIIDHELVASFLKYRASRKSFDRYVTMRFHEDFGNAPAGLADLIDLMWHFIRDIPNNSMRGNQSYPSWVAQSIGGAPRRG